MAKNITITDIAKRAGVSKSTVSAVMNKRQGWASKKTRDRILKVIQEEGYQPSILARSLRRGRTNTIGMIIPAVDIGSAIATRRFADIEGTAAKGGYHVLVSHTRMQPDKDQKCIDALLSREIDGLIIAPEHIGDGEKLRELAINRFPVVTIDSHLDFQTDNVSVDRIHGAERIIEHLLSIGRTKIAFLHAGSGASSVQERLVGYQNACERNGLAFDKLKMITREFGYGPEAGEQMAMELLESGDSFDAVVASNDMVAMGAMRILLHSGRRIPDDVAVTGFDDIAAAKALPISLTTVHQPTQVGKAVIDLLMKRIKDRDCDFQSISLLPELVIRESTQGAKWSYSGGK